MIEHTDLRQKSKIGVLIIQFHSLKAQSSRLYMQRLGYVYTFYHFFHYSIFFAWIPLYFSRVSSIWILESLKFILRLCFPQTQLILKFLKINNFSHTQTARQRDSSEMRAKINTTLFKNTVCNCILSQNKACFEILALFNECWNIGLLGNKQRP